MRPEVADAAVDWLMQNGNDVTLSFYGGEPFVASGLMMRAIERARAAAGADGKRRLRVLTPTNGLMLSGRTLEACREAEVDLAISIDGDENTSERRFGDGTPTTGKLLPLLPNILALEPHSRVLARMTVTPTNVHRFATNVRHVARLGFRRILWQPDFESDWDDEAVAAWGREHAEIAAWVVRSSKSGASVPELPALREMEERIMGGKPRRRCGAGGTLAAVSVDGGIYPCYRLVFTGDPATRLGFGAKPPAVKLGDVERGVTNLAAMNDFASFDPEAVRPEVGDCGTCVARDGCTHSCPALGFTMLGDTRGVPAIACQLMIAAVEAIRPYMPLRRRQERRGLERPMAVAMMAMAMTGAGTAASCGSDVTVEQVGGAGGTGETGGNGGMMADAGSGGTIGFGGFGGAGGSGGVSGGGICPVEVDAGMDGYSGGGICPKEADAEPDVWIGPGLC